MKHLLPLLITFLLTACVTQQQWDRKTIYKGGIVHAKFIKYNDSTWYSPYTRKIVVRRGRNFIVVGTDTCNFSSKLKK